VDGLVLLGDGCLLAGHRLSELVVAGREVIDIGGELVDMLVERGDVGVFAVEFSLQFSDGLVLFVELSLIVGDELLDTLCIAGVLSCETLLQFTDAVTLACDELCQAVELLAQVGFVELATLLLSQLLDLSFLSVDAVESAGHDVDEVCHRLDVLLVQAVSSGQRIELRLQLSVFIVAVAGA